MFNSLSQTILKLTAPGVPDFYQGTEIWDFSLVDPDNRRPVDYDHRKRLLESLRAPAHGEVENRAGLAQAEMATDLIRNIDDGRVKMFVTSRALNFRRDNRDLFDRGAYLPLLPSGGRERHVVSFARKLGDKAVIIIATRFALRLMGAAFQPIETDVGRKGWPDIWPGAWPDVWEDTAALITDELTGCYRDVFTGLRVCARTRQNGLGLSVAEACARLPIALLERVS